MRLAPLVSLSAASLLTAASPPALADLPMPTVGRDPFTVSGIEAVAELDPSGPAALLSGLAASDNVVLAGAVTPLAPAPSGIPEPESYALLLAGLAACGVIAKRRASA